MAASSVRGRYISAVYEDKYFPEKNAFIPFKWETSPGTPVKQLHELGQHRQRDDLNCIDSNHLQSNHGHNDHTVNCTDHEENSIYDINYTQYCDYQYGHSLPRQPLQPVVSIYPLRPPPKLMRPGTHSFPLKVKDLLLLQHNRRLLSNPDHHQLFPAIHASRNRHHGFSARAFSFRYFRSLKASSALPHDNKHDDTNKKHYNHTTDLVTVGHPACSLQGRSHSFNHAITSNHVSPEKIYNNRSINAVDQAQHNKRRRCNSFHLQSASANRRCDSFTFRPLAKLHDDLPDGHNHLAADEDDQSSIAAAAAAVWAGACILVAAAAEHHHLPDTCKVAMKLRDLLQQSANFTTEVLPLKFMSLQNGGRSCSNINECVAQCVKSKSKSMEQDSEMMEAFLIGDGGAGTRRPSCANENNHNSKLLVEEEDDKPTKFVEKVMQNSTKESAKPAKRSSFFLSFKTECIACWCPSSTT